MKSLPTLKKGLRLAMIPLLLGLQPGINLAAEDLLSVYQKAKTSDPQIFTAQASYQSEVEGIAIARGGLLPQLSASASIGARKGDFEAGGSGSTSYYERTDNAALALEQAVFRRDLMEELSRAELIVARAETQLSAAHQDLMVRVSEAYFNVLAASDSLVFAKAEKGAIARQLYQAEQQYRVGLGPVTDVKETRAQLDVAEAQEIRALNDLNITRQRLRVIVGGEAADLKPLLGNMPLDRPTPDVAEEWEKLALDNNLALKASEINVAVAEKGVDVTNAQRLPTVSVAGRLDSNNTDNYKLGDEKDSGGTISLNLRMPLYTGGTTSATVRRAQSQVDVAKSQQTLQKRLTLSEAREAYLNVVFSISHAASLKEALESTRAAYEATKAGYGVGTRTSVDVLLSLKETYRAQRDYSRSRYDYAINWLKLKRAAGTLNDRDMDTLAKWF